MRTIIPGAILIVLSAAGVLGVAAEHPDDIHWQDRPGISLNGPVLALAVYNNELIAGGDFTVAGDIAANRIARWNGTSWAPLGSGMDSHVRALAVYDNVLVAGGLFTSAGDVPANYIASWNGSSWSSLGTGMISPVVALTVYDDKLIAGGYFTAAGGVLVNYIAGWDGSSWSSLGSGMNIWVFALTVYDNDLIAGGNFTTAGGVGAKYIARWNGSAWSPLGAGINGWVNALTVYHDELVAGGLFTLAGGAAANRVARWNGSVWSHLSAGLNSDVEALTVYDDELVAGGAFTTAGGMAANHIARWNGSAWSPLGSGVGGHTPAVHALTVYDNVLVAGGEFLTAGGRSSPHMAFWRTIIDTVDVAITSFSAFARGRGVDLCWALSESADIARCHLLRADEGGDGFERLNPVPLDPAVGFYRDDDVCPGRAYRYRLELLTSGDRVIHSHDEVVVVPAAALVLAQNHPNPFNPATTISFYVPQEGPVRLAIYDTAGRLVRTLLDGEVLSGSGEAVWDGRGDCGRQVSPGIYYCRLEAHKSFRTRKLVLLK